MIQNRMRAAQLLGEKLTLYKNANAVIMAIPRGGVPVGYHLAAELHLPLEVILCERIKDVVDSHLSIGWVSLESVTIPGENLDIPQDYIYHQVALLQHSLKAQYRSYYKDRQPMDLRGKVVILVDDRLETETQMLACLKSIRNQMPQKIIVAVPVATSRAAQQVMTQADDFVCLLMPSRVESAEAFYEYVPPVSDDEVKELLLKAEERYKGVLKC